MENILDTEDLTRFLESDTDTREEKAEEVLVEEVEGVKLQKACTNCRRKKKKCGSEKPICSRCKKLNQCCIYEPMKKRGKKPSSELSDKRRKFSKEEEKIISSFLLSSNSSQNLLVSNRIFDLPRERSAWKLLEFFAKTVSKNFVNLSLIPCKDICVIFYAGMLYFATQHLNHKFKTDGTFYHAVERWNGILDRQGLTQAGVMHSLHKQFGILDNDLAKLAYLEEKFMPRSALTIPFLENADSKYAFFKEFCQGKESDGSLKLNTIFEVNDKFEKYFGFSKESIIFELNEAVNGLLPFGSNIISLLATEEGLKKYVDVYSMQVRNTRVSSEGLFLPIELEIPNSIILDLRAKDGEFEKFQVFAITRERGSFWNFVSEICVYFIPLYR
eukprot:snap_masked-scaffold_7-processed-gene-2.42-mRNA-1 protein AED:1.00 eAED:1.00 QI:0/-1/0/0/-1/1/1/0/386